MLTPRQRAALKRLVKDPPPMTNAYSVQRAYESRRRRRVAAVIIIALSACALLVATGVYMVN